MTVTIAPSFTAQGRYTNFEWVEVIVMGSNSFQSGNNLGYGDYIGNTIALINGTHYIRLTPGFGFSASYPENWSLWIDLNQNGTFESDETLYIGSSSTEILATITVPDTALLGDTRMCVSMRWVVPPVPSAEFTWAEVEDYTVSISN